MIRILIGDDHAVVRQGIKSILSEESDDMTFGEAGNAHEIRERLKGQAWDLVILDINLPDRSGLDVLKELKAAYPKIPVFVLSIHAEEEYAVRMFKAGASGYMTKESMPDELVSAVKRILKGGTYVSPVFADILASQLRKGRDQDPHERLSDREYEVMMGIASGRTVTEIADTLCLSTKTVTTYRARILEKMNVKTTADIVRYTIEHKLT
jgi:two-component system, NarL family, invasion response regulator UvrY